MNPENLAEIKGRLDTDEYFENPETAKAVKATKVMARFLLSLSADEEAIFDAIIQGKQINPEIAARVDQIDLDERIERRRAEMEKLGFGEAEDGE